MIQQKVQREGSPLVDSTNGLAEKLGVCEHLPHLRVAVRVVAANAAESI